MLDAGSSEWGLFNHLDAGLYRAIIAEAEKDHLATTTHTGDASDVKEAADVGTNSIEHGSMTDLISPETFAEMKQKGIAYDPTLSVFEEEIVDMRTGNAEPLTRSLVQQVGPADLLSGTRAMLEKQKAPAKPEQFRGLLHLLNENLLNAYRAGILLIAGSDAGNMLVIHGPTVQHELELWVKAGIPPAIALQAATYNAAKVLRADNRIGSIRKGYDATFVLLDGDPLQEISDVERISQVIFRGERVDRSELFRQENP